MMKRLALLLALIAAPAAAQSTSVPTAQINTAVTDANALASQAATIGTNAKSVGTTATSISTNAKSIAALANTITSQAATINSLVTTINNQSTTLNAQAKALSSTMTAWIHGSSGGGGGGGLPSGVTLTAIDGETLTGTTMSHNFYGRNSYTYAASGSFNTAYANGWDSPNFFPIGPWEEEFFQSSDVTFYNALVWNTDFNTGDVNFNFANTNKVYIVYSPGATVDGTMGTETVALLASDENYAAGVANIASTALSVQNNRPWWLQSTVGILQTGAIGGVPMSTILSEGNPAPSSTTRHFDWNTADTYWFIQGHEEEGGLDGSGTPVTQGDTGANMGSAYNLSGNATYAQQARGHPYGDAVDVYRQQLVGGGYPAPLHLTHKPSISIHCTRPALLEKRKEQANVALNHQR
jgi:hypothetical protein